MKLNHIKLLIASSVALAVAFGLAPATAQADYLYVSNAGNNTIEKFSSSGTDLGVFASAHLSGPLGLAIDSSGNVYAANRNVDTITDYNSSGAYQGALPSNSLNAPIGLAFDSSGNLFAVNLGDNTISEYNSSDSPLGVFASTGLDEPVFIAIGSGGGSGPVSAVPEPSVFGLWGLGALVAGGYAWRKKMRT